MASSWDDYLAEQSYSAVGAYGGGYDSSAYDLGYASSYEPTGYDYSDYEQQYSTYAQPDYSAYTAAPAYEAPTPVYDAPDPFQQPSYQQQAAPTPTGVSDPSTGRYDASQYIMENTYSTGDDAPADVWREPSGPTQAEQNSWAAGRHENRQYLMDNVYSTGDSAPAGVWREPVTLPTVGQDGRPITPAQQAAAAAEAELPVYDSGAALNNSYEAQLYGNNNVYSTNTTSQFGPTWAEPTPDPANNDPLSRALADGGPETADPVVERMGSKEVQDDLAFEATLNEIESRDPLHYNTAIQSGPKSEDVPILGWLGDRASDVGTVASNVQESAVSQVVGGALGMAGDALYTGLDTVRDGVKSDPVGLHGQPAQDGGLQTTQAGLFDIFGFVKPDTPGLGGIQQAWNQTSANLGKATNFSEFVSAPVTGAIDVPDAWRRGREGEMAYDIAKGNGKTTYIDIPFLRRTADLPVIGQALEMPSEWAHNASAEEKEAIVRVYENAEAVEPGSGGNAVWEYYQTPRNWAQRGVADAAGSPWNVVPVGRAAALKGAGFGRVMAQSEQPLIRAAGPYVEKGFNVTAAGLGSVDAAADLGLTPALSAASQGLRNTKWGRAALSPFDLTERAKGQQTADQLKDATRNVRTVFEAEGRPPGAQPTGEPLVPPEGGGPGVRSDQFTTANSTRQRRGKWTLIQHGETGEAIITTADQSELITPNPLTMEQAESVLAELNAGAPPLEAAAWGERLRTGFVPPDADSFIPDPPPVGANRSVVPVDELDGQFSLVGDANDPDWYWLEDATGQPVIGPDGNPLGRMSPDEVQQQIDNLVAARNQSFTQSAPAADMPQPPTHLTGDAPRLVTPTGEPAVNPALQRTPGIEGTLPRRDDVPVQGPFPSTAGPNTRYRVDSPHDAADSYEVVQQSDGSWSVLRLTRDQFNRSGLEPTGLTSTDADGAIRQAQDLADVPRPQDARPGLPRSGSPLPETRTSGRATQQPTPVASDGITAPLDDSDAVRLRNEADALRQTLRAAETGQPVDLPAMPESSAIRQDDIPASLRSSSANQPPIPQPRPEPGSALDRHVTERAQLYLNDPEVRETGFDVGPFPGQMDQQTYDMVMDRVAEIQSGAQFRSTPTSPRRDAPAPTVTNGATRLTDTPENVPVWKVHPDNTGVKVGRTENNGGMVLDVLQQADGRWKVQTTGTTLGNSRVHGTFDTQDAAIADAQQRVAQANAGKNAYDANPAPTTRQTTQQGPTGQPASQRAAAAPATAQANADEIARRRSTSRPANTAPEPDLPSAYDPNTVIRERVVTNRRGQTRQVYDIGTVSPATGQFLPPSDVQMDAVYRRMMDMPEDEFLLTEAGLWRGEMYNQTFMKKDPPSRTARASYDRQQAAYDRYLDLMAHRMNAAEAADPGKGQQRFINNLTDPQYGSNKVKPEVVEDIKQRAGLDSSTLDPTANPVNRMGARAATPGEVASAGSARGEQLRTAFNRPSNVVRTAGQAPTSTERLRNLGLASDEVEMMATPMPKAGDDKTLGDLFFDVTDEIDEAVQLANTTTALAKQQQKRLDELAAKYNTTVDDLRNLDWNGQSLLADGYLDRMIDDQFIPTPGQPSAFAAKWGPRWTDTKQFLRSFALYNKLTVPRHVITNLIGNPMLSVFRPSMWFGQGMLFDHSNWMNTVRKVYNEGVGKAAPDNTAYGNVTRSLGYTPQSNVVGAAKKDQLDYLFGANSGGAKGKVSNLLLSKKGYLFAQGVDQGWREIAALLPAKEQLPQMVREIRKSAKESAQRMGVLVSDAQIDAAIDGLVDAARRNKNNAGLPAFSAVDLKKVLSNLEVRGGPAADNWADRVHRDWRQATSKLMKDMSASADEWAFSFRKTNADEVLSNFTTFHIWASRASKKYATEMLRNPHILAAYVRATEGLEKMAEENQWPDSVKGFVQLMGSWGGFVGFIEPNFFMPAMLMKADEVYREEGEYGLTALGSIIKEVNNYLPILPVWRVATYYSGLEGGGNMAPNPFYSWQDAGGAVMNQANHWLAKAGIRQGQDAGLLPAPVQGAQNAIAHRVSGWFDELLGNPDWIKQVPLESQEYLRDDYRQRQVLADVIQEQFDSLPPEEQAKGVDQLIDEAMAEPDGDLYQEAYGRRNAVDTAQVGIRAVVPLQTRVRNEASDQRAITKREGTPAEQDAAWDIDNAVRRAGPEDAHFEAAMAEYNAAGDDFGHSIAGTVGRIRDGQIRQTIRVNGRDYFPEQVAAMSESERFELAEAFLDGMSRSTGEDIRTRVDTRFDAQNEILAANPDIAAAVEFSRRAEEYGPGIDQFIMDTAKINAPYRDYLATIQAEPGTDEFRDKATNKYAAAQAVQGMARDIFNPIQNDEGAGRVAGLPEEMTLGNAHAMRQAEREAKNAEYQASRAEREAEWELGNEYIQDARRDLPKFGSIKQRIDAYDPSGEQWRLYLNRVAGDKDAKIDGDLYDALMNEYDGSIWPSGGAEEYIIWADAQPAGADLSFDAWREADSAAYRAQQDQIAGENVNFDPASLVGGVSQPLVMPGQASTAADPTSLGVPHPEWMPGGEARVAQESRLGYTPNTLAIPGNLNAVPADGSLASAIVADAQRYVGSDYVLGAKGTDLNGDGVIDFDCSGLIYVMARNAGIDVPPRTYEQWGEAWTGHPGAGRKLDPTEPLVPGDLVFFDTGDYGEQAGLFPYDGQLHAEHVGIYLQDGMIIHAASPELGVIVSPLRDFGNQYIGARRVFAP